MRYITLIEALKIAEDVTGIDADTLARISRLELLDSALHTPASGFGEVEFYSDFFSVDVDEFAKWLKARASQAVQ